VRCRTLGCIPDFSAQLATYVGDWHQTDERERQLIFQPIALTLYAGSELGSGIIPRTVFVAKELKPTYGRLPQPRRILFLDAASTRSVSRTKSIDGSSLHHARNVNRRS
jgi:hypothetical protein